MSDETTLLARARAGDGAAFVDLVESCRDRTWAVCYRITGNTHDAEDAMQDALVAAWRNLDRFRGSARFATWLHRIAANASLAVLRRRRDLPSDDVDPGADVARSFAEHVANADLLQRALTRIPEDFRVALVLREWGEMTYAEIAAHQSIPVQTVKSRLNRGRHAIAALLSDQS